MVGVFLQGKPLTVKGVLQKAVKVHEPFVRYSIRRPASEVGSVLLMQSSKGGIVLQPRQIGVIGATGLTFPCLTQQRDAGAGQKGIVHPIGVFPTGRADLIRSEQALLHQEV